MRRVAVWAGWYVGLFAVWLLLVGTVQRVELIAGVCAAAIGVTATGVVRAQGLLSFQVEWRWLRLAWRPLARVVPEFFKLLAALVRRPEGTFRQLEFPAGGERAADAGRRAFAVLAGSLAPNRLVVDFDPETGKALVHDLVPGAGSADLP
ncbi:MAG: hypothetical protein E6G03_11695 [Actinobacteria bacterium]|nr:MAG: hypothetical protein E6G03_11695 [Actinomycetota bacterium]